MIFFGFFCFFVFLFFADAKAVQEITESSSSFSYCVGKALGYDATPFNVRYTSACLPHDVTQKTTSFERTTSSGGEEGRGLKGSQPSQISNLEALLSFCWSNNIFCF